MQVHGVHRSGGSVRSDAATRPRGLGTVPQQPTSRRARWWRPVVPVRARVLASVLVMSVLGMAVAGGVVYLVQSQTLTSSITSSLEQEVAEFRTLAETGLDPETGAPFTSIERLLRVALQRNVPDRNETYLTFLDGVPLAFNGGERPIALEAEPAVLAAVADLPPDSEVVIRDVSTSSGLARMAIVPVRLGDEASAGSFVMAYSVDRELQDLQQPAGSTPWSPWRPSWSSGSPDGRRPAACSVRCGACGRPPNGSARLTSPNGSRRAATTTSRSSPGPTTTCSTSSRRPSTRSGGSSMTPATRCAPRSRSCAGTWSAPRSGRPPGCRRDPGPAPR